MGDGGKASRTASRSSAGSRMRPRSIGLPTRWTCWSILPSKRLKEWCYSKRWHSASR